MKAKLSSRILTHVFLIAVALICVLPLVFSLKTSLEPARFAFQVPTWELHDPSLEHYFDVINRQDLMLPTWFLNSLVVSFSIVALQLLVVSTAAYAFARLTFPGRNLIFFLFLFTIMVPTQVTMIPVYTMIRSLKLLDSFLALILPAMANVFGLFMIRQFFLGIPKELEEAAMIDGAGRWRTFFTVMVPQVKAGLVALGILTFLGSWNDLFWPMIVMNKLEMRTLPVGLTVLNGTYATERALVLAGAFFAIIPALILYGIFQKRILQGSMLSGLGGR
jgi:multiple sugar transport system permease protein